MSSSPDPDRKLDSRTISDFGEQWTKYRDNQAYYGSLDLLADILEPLVHIEELQGMNVAEIGSGTGRIVNTLLQAGVARVTAVEPSAAFDVLVDNTSHAMDKVRLIRGRGEETPFDDPFDMVLSIGVLHHIKDPGPTVRRAHSALKSGGRMVVWLYAAEGNGAYLAFVKPLRWVTQRLPHIVLAALCYPLDLLAYAYARLCRSLPGKAPMREYMTDVYGRLAPDKRRLVIYDQLNPAYAKYYTGAEVFTLLDVNGFKDVQISHRHGYSWTAVGTKYDVKVGS
jgi:SAM-dependent methyltransferase